VASLEPRRSTAQAMTNSNMRIILNSTDRTKCVMVLSDLHIGDPRQSDAKIDRIVETIETNRPDILVLNGDTIECDLATRDQMYKLIDVCSNIDKVIVLEGNHDTKKTKYLAYTIGATYGSVLAGYSLASSYIVEHGSRFDSWWVRFPISGWSAILFNRLIYNISNFDVQKWLRGFGGINKKLEKQHKIARKAWPDKNIVITGHTHIPTGNNVRGKGYFNSGDWIYHKSYVIIHNGKARLENAG